MRKIDSERRCVKVSKFLKKEKQALCPEFSETTTKARKTGDSSDAPAIENQKRK